MSNRVGRLLKLEQRQADAPTPGEQVDHSVYAVWLREHPDADDLAKAAKRMGLPRRSARRWLAAAEALAAAAQAGQREARARQADAVSFTPQQRDRLAELMVGVRSLRLTPALIPVAVRVEAAALAERQLQAETLLNDHLLDDLIARLVACILQAHPGSALRQWVSLAAGLTPGPSHLPASIPPALLAPYLHDLPEGIWPRELLPWGRCTSCAVALPVRGRYATERRLLFPVCPCCGGMAEVWIDDKEDATTAK